MSCKISVVTPSYNQARYLDETLRSVVSQREDAHEYFVLDGGSKDGSADLIRRYAHLIDYWHSERDKGQSDAIHQGFSRATGDVLCWINSDDMLLPGTLRSVREAFDAHPDWDILTAYHARVDENTRVVAMFRTPPQGEGQFRRGLLRVCQQTTFFRRSLYERLGGLNLDLHCVMDTELWLRMAAAGAVWGHLPRYLAGFRWHSEAKMIGTAYAIKREEEREWLRNKYPQYHPRGVRGAAHLAGYRAGQILGGNWVRAAMESRRNRGKRLTEVFGEWVVPGAQEAAAVGAV